MLGQKRRREEADRASVGEEEREADGGGCGERRVVALEYGEHGTANDNATPTKLVEERAGGERVVLGSWGWGMMMKMMKMMMMLLLMMVVVVVVVVDR
jgi:hypothetical protein